MTERHKAMHCLFCEQPIASPDAASEAGWIPSFWDGAVEKDGPVCPTCIRIHLRYNPEHCDFERQEPVTG
jgi:hypothetical protein